MWKEVRGMVLIMVTSWVPFNKGNDVTKKHSETFKKIPLASFEKTLVWAGTPSKEGMVIIHIYAVEKGKYEESYNLVTKRLFEFNNIEGYRYKIETLMTLEEGMAVMGVVPPK
jgi:hypothetical protein